MPQAIAYCDRCAKQIPPGALRDSIVSGDTMICPQCAALLSPEERATVSGSRVPAADSRPAARPRDPGRPSARRAERSRPPSRVRQPAAAPQGSLFRGNMPVIVLSAAGMLVGVTASLLVLRRGSRDAPKPLPVAESGRGDGGAASGQAGPTGAPPASTAAAATGGTGAAAIGPAPGASRRAAARLDEIRGWVDQDLNEYARIREALAAVGKEFPGTPEAAEAERILAEVDAHYAKLADEALELAIVVGKGVAETGDHKVAASGIRSIESRFGEGPWLASTGKAKIEKALAELEEIRVSRRDREDPGYGIPPERDTLAARVPEAAGYRLVYDLNLGKLGRDIRYYVDRSAEAGAFARIAYLIELYSSQDAEPKFLYVSMAAFTDDLAKIGVPTFQSGAKFQCAVSDMTVVSNVDGIATGSGLSGSIEFWPNNYGTHNWAKVPGASEDKYDFGDAATDPADGYGCMQVHNPSARQTLFAVNKWNAGSGADVGIGNNTAGNPDWTFTGSASRWPRKRLRVLVK